MAMLVEGGPMLDEAKQREVYEWKYPELKGKDCDFADFFFGDGSRYSVVLYVDNTGAHNLKVTRLYLSDGTEDWRAIRECVEKLNDERTEVCFVPYYDKDGARHYHWILLPFDDELNDYSSTIVGGVNLASEFFFHALSEMLEVRG
jgi:hypothetical protein